MARQTWETTAGRRTKQLLKEGGPSALFEMAFAIRELYTKVPNAVFTPVATRFEELLAYIAYEDGQ